MCGKQIDRTCKDDSGGPGTDGQSPSGKLASVITLMILTRYNVSHAGCNTASTFRVKKDLLVFLQDNS